MTLVTGGLLNGLLVTGGLGLGGSTAIRFHLYIDARATIQVDGEFTIGPRDTALVADAFLPRSTAIAVELESFSINPRDTTIASEFEVPELTVESRETTLAADPFLPRGTTIADL